MIPAPRRAVNAPPSPLTIYHPVVNASLLGLGVFAMCLLGILSRPGGDLASFWPSNAFMLGMLVRYPHFAHRGAWVAAALGYVMADALTGSNWEKNLLLNLGNLVSVATGYLVFRRIPTPMHRLHTPMSVLYMLLAMVCAAFTAGLCGLLAYPLLLDNNPLHGFAIWFVTEIATDIALLPVLLTLPSRLALPRHLKQHVQQLPTRMLPALALLLSVALGLLVGGPGAVAFPVPALMWCAVSYSLFTTSLLTLGVSAWSLVGISMALQAATTDMVDRELLLSIRLGLSLVMLTPIMIGSVMAANQSLVQRLRQLADHDPLTGLPNRRAFLEAAHDRLSALQQRRSTCAVVMLDIDHFKTVNDRYGHAAGDAVLAQFGQLLRECLRDEDLPGRLGGEEFAALLPHASPAEAWAAAERLRARFAATSLEIAPGTLPLHCTVSIGMTVEVLPHSTLGMLLGQADQALYQAKAQGRNQVVVYPTPLH